MSKPEKEFVRGEGDYALNQKKQVFKDRRTKRKRTRAEKRRRAIEESHEE